jgi:hypothetical protein
MGLRMWNNQLNKEPERAVARSGSLPIGRYA